MQEETTTENTCNKTSRRGVFAIAAAVAAIAGFRAKPAAAGANVTVLSGSTDSYGLAATAGTFQPIIPTIGTTTHGVIGSASSLAVADLDSGVLGARSGSGRAGVFGVNTTDGFGVVGKSSSGTAVKGQSISGIGVNGISSSSQGVLGQASNLEGVRGESATSAGVHGISTSGLGVRAQSTSSNALLAVNSASNIPALRAVNNSAGTRVAAQFTGNVRVEGNFAVTGTKAAAVPMQDGSLATVYCQESPEPWFEDFGRAHLIDGAARIDLEEEFASIIRLDSYMVFVMPEGNGQPLYIHARDDSGFEVRELNAGRGTFPFSYRIVARRKDIAGDRLVRLDPIESEDVPVQVSFIDTSSKPASTTAEV